MHDAFLVRGVEGVCDLIEDRQARGDGDGAALEAQKATDPFQT